MSSSISNAPLVLPAAKDGLVRSTWGTVKPHLQSERRNATPLPADHGSHTALDEVLVKDARSGPDTDSPAGVSVKAQSSEKAAFTIKEASTYSGLSRSFLYGLFDQKLVPRLKAGKRVLIMKSDLDAYLLSLREAGSR